MSGRTLPVLESMSSDKAVLKPVAALSLQHTAPVNASKAKST
jgi:hypothetical protein